MSNLREFYKVDQLHKEIRDLKKENTELKKEAKYLKGIVPKLDQKFLPEAKKND